MKKTPVNKPRKVADMPAEYKLDYKKAKPNRFASRMKDGPLVVVLDPDPLHASDTSPKYGTKI
jgi:hypothetical protein